MIASRLPDGTTNSEWLRARCGRVTASHMWRIMAQQKNGSPTAEWRNYMVDLLAERDTGDALDRYITADMQRGIDLEAAALAAYEDMTGAWVEPGYWVDAGDFGATPDAFVGAAGLVECKCPRSTTMTHLRYFEPGIGDRWRWQMIAQMAATGAEWCDLVIYDDRMRRGLELIVRRLTADECRDDMARMRVRVREFLDEMGVAAGTGPATTAAPPLSAPACPPAAGGDPFEIPARLDRRAAATQEVT